MSSEKPRTTGEKSPLFFGMRLASQANEAVAVLKLAGVYLTAAFINHSTVKPLLRNGAEERQRGREEKSRAEDIPSLNQSRSKASQMVIIQRKKEENVPERSSKQQQGH
ncbi:uncharacterized [Tachysurus ichikawai]